MAQKNTFDWGIYLRDAKRWADLPPRLCKPTPHNCNLVPELIAVMWELIGAGHDPELRRIPKEELKALKEMRYD